MPQYISVLYPQTIPETGDCSWNGVKTRLMGVQIYLPKGVCLLKVTGRKTALYTVYEREKERKRIQGLQTRERKHDIWKPRVLIPRDAYKQPFLVAFAKPRKRIRGISFVKPVLCFLLGNSPASEFYMPTFRNTLFHLHRLMLLDNSPASEFSTPTFRNTLFHLHRLMLLDNSSASEFSMPTFRNPLSVPSS